MTDELPKRKGRRLATGYNAPSYVMDLTDTQPLPVLSAADFALSLEKNKSLVEMEIRDEVQKNIAQAYEIVVAKHHFKNGEIYCRGVKKDPVSGEYKEVYWLNCTELNNPDLEFEEILPVVFERQKTLTGTTDQTRSVKLSGSNLVGMSNPAHVFENSLDANSLSLPMFLFVKDASFDSELGVFLKVEIYSIDTNGFVLSNGKTLSLEEVENLHESKLITDQEYGVLLFMYLKICTPSVAQSLYNSFAIEYELVKNGTETELKVRRYCNELGIHDHIDFAMFADKNSLAKTNMHFRFLARIHKIPFLIKHFKSKMESCPNRLMLNPFSPDFEKIVEGSDFIAAISRIRSFRHFGQDALVHGKNYACLFDGVSESQGVVLMLELITRYFASNNGKIDDDEIIYEFLDSAANDLGEKCTLNEIVSTMARYEYNPESKELSLFASADAFALHINKNGEIVQVLGGEAFGSFALRSKVDSDVTNTDVSTYIQNSNQIESGVSVSRVYHESRSRAALESGDMVILMTDFIDKIVDAFNYGLIPYECFESDEPNVSGSPVNLYNSYIGPNKVKYADRSVQNVTNRDQRHKIHAVNLRPFIVMLQNMFTSGEIKTFEDLKAWFLENFRTELDDSGFYIRYFN